MTDPFWESVERARAMKMNLLHAHITDTTTGETRVHHWVESDPRVVAFDWGDNNNSCDCNRSLHFSRAGGGDGWSEMAECGDERFRVKIVNDGGDVVYADPTN